MRRIGLPLAVLVVLLVLVTWQVWPGWGRPATPAVQSGTSGPHQADQVALSITPLVVSTPVPTATPVILAPQKVTDVDPPWVNAEEVVVIDAASGQVLYGRNEHERTPMASITKIATAIVTLEHGNIRDVVHVDYDPSGLINSTRMGCDLGETYTLEDLLYGLMLPSGNDAALAIATYIGGSEEGFVQMMNDKVQELGLEDTHFANPHGLDTADHYSSAYDMAMLGRYGMQNATFRQLAQALEWDVHGTKNLTVYNLNRFLWNYDGADGIKVGFTEEAGRTIVASATRNGHRVIVAFMHGGDIVTDVTPLLDYVFDNYQW